MSLMKLIPRFLFNTNRKIKGERSHVAPDPGQGLSNANARGWFNNILMHDMAEKMELSRIAAAQAYGIPAGDHVTKFAGQSQTTNNYGGGFLKGAAVAALVGGGALSLGLAVPLLMGLLTPDEKEPTPIQNPPVIDGGSYDITIETIDGKLVPTNVQKVTE